METLVVVFWGANVMQWLQKSCRRFYLERFSSAAQCGWSCSWPKPCGLRRTTTYVSQQHILSVIVKVLPAMGER